MRIRRKRIYKKKVVKKSVNPLQRWFGNPRNLLIFSISALVLIVLLSSTFLVKGYLDRRARSRFNGALSLYTAQRYTEALKDFEGIASSLGGGRLKTLSLLYAGNILYKEGKYERAIETYTRIIDSEELRPLVLYNIGKTYEAMGRLKEAEDFLNQARRDSDPMDSLLSLELASIYERMGEKEKALNLYRALEEKGEPLVRELAAEARAGIR